MRRVTFSLLTLCSLLLLSRQSQAQQVWQKYSGNPVMRTVGSGLEDPIAMQIAMEPGVMYDSTSHSYRAWFTSVSRGVGAHYRVSEALSLDGQSWYLSLRSPEFSGGPSGSYDDQVRSPSVLFDGKQFKMFYTGYTSTAGIGLATSADGRSWTRYADTPVVSHGIPGSWNSAGVDFASAMLVDTTYYMWYGGGSTDGHNTIGLSTSKDGIHWEAYSGNPVFAGSGNGWDAVTVAAPGVVRVNGTFYMFYLGTSGSGCCGYSIGLATSTDGKHWVRYSANPLLTPEGGWEGTTLAGFSVVFHDKTFHIWYSGYSSSGWQTGYATSPLVILGVSRPGSLPASAELFQSYPNPFNPSTTIRYALQEKAHVVLSVFNSLGQHVATLVDGSQEAGYHDVQFDATGISSGVYFYRLQAGDFAQSRRLVLLK